MINERPKIRKRLEINEYLRLKNMNEEIKEWKTQSYKSRVAHLLMLDCVSFSYNEEDGIVFTAPAEYVERLKKVLITCYGCKKAPVITEY